MKLRILLARPADFTFNRPTRLFLAATVIYGITVSCWQLFLNFFILGRGFDREFLGLVNAMPYTAALFTAIPAGFLCNRLGRRNALRLGLLVAILGMGCQVLVRPAGWVLGLAFVAGMGNTLFLVSQAPFMMGVSTPENRSQLFGLNFGLSMAAGVVGNLLGGQLPLLFSRLFQVNNGNAQIYQAVLLTSVFLGSLAMLPLYWLHEPAPARASALPVQLIPPAAGWGALLNRPLYLRLMLPNLLVGFGAAILMPFLNLYFVERFNLSKPALGALFSLSSFLTGLACIMAPRLARRFNSKIWVIVLTRLSSLVFLILLGFSADVRLAAMGFLARAMLMTMSVPLFDSFALEQVPAEGQATVSSLLNLSWNVGWVFGPIASGFILVRGGFTPLFITTTLFYCGAVFLTWLFFHNVKETPASEPLPTQAGVETV